MVKACADSVGIKEKLQKKGNSTLWDSWYPPILVLQERERYREPVRDAIKALLALNWKIEYESEGVSTGGREQLHRQDTVSN